MDKLYEEAETGCCPRFNPEPWDEKEITLQDRMFLKDRARSIFHIPLNFGGVMTKNMEKISGTFLSKVFEGPYKDAGKWAKGMQEFIRSKGKDIKKMYFFYILIGTWADAVWAIRFYEKHGFHPVSPEEKETLLKKYWSIPQRQIETSVVLAESGFGQNHSGISK